MRGWQHLAVTVDSGAAETVILHIMVRDRAMHVTDASRSGLNLFTRQPQIWRAGPGTTPDTRERTASEGAPSDARTISRGARGSFGFHGTAASARQGAPTLQEPTSETLLVVQRVRLVHPTVVAATTLEQESVPYTRMKIPVTSTRKSVAPLWLAISSPQVSGPHGRRRRLPNQ